MITDQQTTGNFAAADAATEERLHTLIGTHVLPLVPALMLEDEPIPVYALRLVGDCLQAIPDIALPCLKA